MVTMDTKVKDETRAGVPVRTRPKVSHMWQFDTVISAFPNHNLPHKANRLAQHQSYQQVRKLIGPWQSDCRNP
jgi:hypothetical protein